MERPSVIDHIVSDLKHKIIIGELEEGQMLPPQDELARDMAVSRASIREALNQLRLIGLIETHHGKGSLVKKRPPVAFLDSISYLFTMDTKSAAELLDARLHVESAVAALSATNASDSDLERMRILVESMEDDLISRDIEAFAEKDVQFHMVVASSSKNRFLAKIVDLIREILHRFNREIFMREPSRLSVAARYHREIYQAIQSRNPQAARRHMEEHILSIIRRLNESGLQDEDLRRD